LGELFDEVAAYLALLGPLFCEFQDILLHLAVRVATFIALQILNLRVAESGLPTDGLVVVQSVITAV
jgi:hypothetical protein